MEARVRTAFDPRGIVIGDRTVPYWAGAMSYWRVDRRDWKACLATLAGAGLTLVDTCVPWGVHETGAGRYDWSGARDLAGFLTAAASLRLGVVLRPGPVVNDELTYLGLPERIVRDDALLARGAHGGPVWLPAPPRAFPVPSYASDRFHAEVRGWFAAVAAVVEPFLAPDGPVVALVVDHEAQMFYRLGAYDHDYQPDASRWWHQGGGDGDPPTAWDPERPDRGVRWVRFKDRYLGRALGRFAAALDEVGFGGIARLHHVPPGEPWWGAIPDLAAATGGPVGIAVDVERRDLPTVRRRALHVVGSQALPLAPEVELGLVPWLPALAPDADVDAGCGRDVVLTLLAAGVRGVGLHMAVERDRHGGAAIDRRGRPGPDLAWIRTLSTVLDEIDWTSLRRATPVALILSRADLRVALASSLADPAPPGLAEVLALGPGGAAELGRDRDAIEYRRWFAAIEAALTLAEVPYAIVDEGCPVERLTGYEAVIAPTLHRVDRALWRRLKSLAERKQVVVTGPGLPDRDELDQPLGDDASPPKRAGRIRPGSLDDLPGLAQDLAALAGDAPAAWLVERPDDLDAAAFADAGGRTRVVFVASRAERTETAELTAPAGARLRDPFDDHVFDTRDHRVRIPVPAHGIRMLVVESAR